MLTPTMIYIMKLTIAYQVDVAGKICVEVLLLRTNNCDNPFLSFYEKQASHSKVIVVLA